MTELLPESLTWGVLLTLALRALPSIIEKGSKALADRAEAKRLGAEKALVDAKAEASHEERRDAELAEMRALAGQLRDDLEEAKRIATQCIHDAEVDHAVTKGRLDTCERDLAKCTAEHASTKRLLDGLRSEMDALRKDMR